MGVRDGGGGEPERGRVPLVSCSRSSGPRCKLGQLFALKWSPLRRELHSIRFSSADLSLLLVGLRLFGGKSKGILERRHAGVSVHRGDDYY